VVEDVREEVPNRDSGKLDHVLGFGVKVVWEVGGPVQLSVSL
jgi:hypothetical protein